MKLVVAGLEFDTDTCKVCPDRRNLLYQGNLCSRCPIFNCNLGVDEEGEEWCLVEPDEYREDWAIEFFNWIESGFTNYPELRL